MLEHCPVNSSRGFRHSACTATASFLDRLANAIPLSGFVGDGDRRGAPRRAQGLSQTGAILSSLSETCICPFTASFYPLTLPRSLHAQYCSPRASARASGHAALGALMHYFLHFPFPALPSRTLASDHSQARFAPLLRSLQLAMLAVSLIESSPQAREQN